MNKIERGVRGDVSISQLFTFADVLHISPTHLLTPRAADGEVQLTPGRRMGAADARLWIRGSLPLSGDDPLEWFLDLPRDEQRTVLESSLTAGMNDLYRALMSDDITERVDAVMKALQSKEAQDG